MQYFLQGYGGCAVAEPEMISISTGKHTACDYNAETRYSRRYKDTNVLQFPNTRHDVGNPAHVLAELRALSDGWDSYAAPAPNEQTINQARALLDILARNGCVPSHVGPSVLGGVGLTVEREDTEYAIEFRNSGKGVVTVIAADGDFTVCDLKNAQTAQADILSLLNGYLG